MKDLLKFIIEEITGLKKFEIEKNQENSINTYNLIVPADYIGMIIGKKGKTIKIIRNLLKVRAIIDKERFNLTVNSK